MQIATRLLELGDRAAHPKKYSQAVCAFYSLFVPVEIVINTINAITQAIFELCALGDYLLQLTVHRIISPKVNVLMVADFSVFDGDHRLCSKDDK